MEEQNPKKAKPETASHAEIPEPVQEFKQSFPPVSQNTAFSRNELEKRNALIKAWEENEKAKVERKIHEKLSAVGSWEAAKRAYMEMKMKKNEEKLERKKGEYAEIMKNKMAEIHMAAEEKKAKVEATRNEECLKIEETAAKFKSVGRVPGSSFGCIGC
ncbi:remorin 1.4-like [Mercurialis annua]|uniref:remorin 1.4-like n=1 Tax=Mercurialis annua TaxID=3986 RepID=UPI0021604E48|nr:remorin 1.4-like [Mercurialis annua]